MPLILASEFQASLPENAETAKMPLGVPFRCSAPSRRRKIFHREKGGGISQLLQRLSLTPHSSRHKSVSTCRASNLRLSAPSPRNARFNLSPPYEAAKLKVIPPKQRVAFFKARRRIYRQFIQWNREMPPPSRTRTINMDLFACQRKRKTGLRAKSSWRVVKPCTTISPPR